MPRAKVNGAEIYYEEAGSGPPLILSPGGLQGVLSSYQPVRTQLSQTHRVIVYDRRFGGQSTSPLVVQTWDLVCQDIIGLMDVLGIEQAHLGGGSFGAAIDLLPRPPGEGGSSMDARGRERVAGWHLPASGPPDPQRRPSGSAAGPVSTPPRARPRSA